MLNVHFILYVEDQRRSAKFYRQVLGKSPRLNIPGMTEFDLGTGTVLGLMPEEGIVRLLGSAIGDPAKARAAPRAELYLIVDDPKAYLFRALAAGAKALSPLQARDWGHEVAYLCDPDGHVIAFARILNEANTP